MRFYKKVYCGSTIARSERERASVGFPESPKSARIRMSPRKHAGVDEKNQPDEGLVFGIGGGGGN